MKDTFVKVYTPLSETSKQLIFKIKETADQLEALFDLVNSREMSIAKTNLEQTIMWGVKAVALSDKSKEDKL